MTYLQFHLVFVLPPIALLAWLAHRDERPLAGWLEPDGRRARLAVGAILLLALVYTTPWDDHLVARGVWGYPEGRVWFTIGHVPFEEYLFFLLQPILTGSFLFLLARRTDPPSDARPVVRSARLWGASLFLAAAVSGAWLLRYEWGTYLGLILAWAAPVAALQWAVGGTELVRHARIVTQAILVPTVYLWIADRIALGLGIWFVEERFTTGFAPFGLPIEEATFFLVTNVLVVQGVLLFLVLGRRWGDGWIR